MCDCGCELSRRERWKLIGDEALREAAQELRNHWYPRVPGEPQFTQGMDAGMDLAADLIDPDKEGR